MRKDMLGLQKMFLAVLFLAAFGCQTPQVVTGPQQKDFFGPPKGLPLQQGFLGPQSTRAQGEQRVLMVAVRFPDIEPRFSLDRLRDKVVADLNNYVKAQSYGRTWVRGPKKARPASGVKDQPSALWQWPPSAVLHHSAFGPPGFPDASPLPYAIWSPFQVVATLSLS
jgi:hypothetical protein